MAFQASDLKGKQFLNLLNNNLTDIEPLYTKRGPLLRLTPPGDSMNMGKGYDDMIGCAICSLSQCLMQ